MCTLTWWVGGSGTYEVFFNRDEFKDRPPALPPSVGERDGVRFIAPIDPKTGGTWLMANEAGLTVALLNWYEGGGSLTYRPEWGNRGDLVLGLAGVTRWEEVAGRLAGADGGAYPPFRLIGFAAGQDGGLEVAGWLGRGEGAVEPIPVDMPVTSSSVDPEGVSERRRRLLRSLVAASGGGDPEVLWDYHRGRADGGGGPCGWSVRMNRPDAQTWSISRVTVAPDAVRFRYEAQPRDLVGEVSRHDLTLERRLRP